MGLIEKLKAGTYNVKIISWPGTKEKIGIAILTEAEVQAAQFDTEALFKARDIAFSASTLEAYQSELNTQVLSRALVDPQTKKPLFKTAEELRGLIAHPDVKANLTQEYTDWQTECSPSPIELPDDKYADLYAEVKKNPSITSALNSITLRGLITYSANLPASCPPDSGSISS